jgi:hypothetical protein
MSRFRPLALGVLVMLGGCHPHKTGASSADSHAPGTTTANVAANCSKYPPGSPGVIRTFCDGPAIVKLSVGAAAYTFTGGSCSTTGNVFTLNLGVVAGRDLAGPKPDYIGMTANTANGAFNDAVLAVNAGGKGYAVTQNSGEVAATGGNFTGKAVTGEAVSGTFTC